MKKDTSPLSCSPGKHLEERNGGSLVQEQKSSISTSKENIMAKTMDTSSFITLSYTELKACPLLPQSPRRLPSLNRKSGLGGQNMEACIDILVNMNSSGSLMIQLSKVREMADYIKTTENVVSRGG